MRTKAQARVTTPTTPGDTALIDVHEVARLLDLSTKSVYLFSREGRIPGPVTLGTARRWRTAELRTWIAADCPPRSTTGESRPNGSKAL